MFQYAGGRPYTLRLGDANEVEITHGDGEIVRFTQSVSTDLPKTGDWVFVTSDEGKHALGWILCRKINLNHIPHSVNTVVHTQACNPDMYIVALGSARDVHFGINANVLALRPNLIVFSNLSTCIRLESPSPYLYNLLALAKETIKTLYRPN